MEQLKALKNDPEKLEAALQGYWKRFDPTGKGFVTYEDFARISLEVQKESGNVQQPNKEQQAKLQELIDPEKTGKFNYEQFKKLTLYGLENA